MTLGKYVVALLTLPIRLVATDFRVQIPLLLAITYYPERIKFPLPEKVYSCITDARFLQALKILIGFSVARAINNKLSQYVINNWKRDAKFINAQEIVLITGGSSGLGALMGEDFAQRGVKVISLDVNPPQETQAGIHFYKVDVTSSADLAAAGAEIRKAHGDPTVLINNAAVGYAMTLLDEPEECIRRSFEVNTFSHFLTAKEFLPAMIKKNHGHIVTVASMASYVTVASIIDYNCTKSSAVAFHEGVASELKHRYNAPNVRTSLINPTWIRTPLIEALTSDPNFNDIVLEPTDVSSQIVKQVISGRSGHVVLPKFYTPITGIRAWPSWLQESVRNHMGSLFDLNVRSVSKPKNDPTLTGGTVADLK
ncbi:hypothetical protein VC83_07373 [Pseudogymnoascus destructans]|uniref:Short-chain dehydrogenase/reductase 3 n=2 Tax=Pseudogymnoascus destructans TaxID=655981 RepID=L8GD65_PSED2|nr:uncharacterized protein VC83_07373 [Pseudogymnoascus destructans]ELR10036.1 hypothetical protein GMDG_04441 [Pseudogymnoascus destructans 20631-21]OAF56163.1 hypothetical protein VC83_07373 [Pseudogymnoascus destructans]